LFRKHGVDEFRDEMDQLCETVLPQGKHLLPCIKRQNQPVRMVERNIGKIPFRDVTCTSIPTMVMTCMRVCKKESRDEMIAGKHDQIHPLVLRSYDFPPQPKDEEFFCDVDPIVDSSSEVSAAEAAVGTGSLPGVMKRVRSKVNGKLVSIADGGLFANCPLVVAFDQARHLYPNRPLGVVLSLGFEKVNNDTQVIAQALKVVKSVNPKLHFHRIIPDHLTAKANPLATELSTHTILEERVRNYVLKNEQFAADLDETMNILFSQKRTPLKYPTTATKYSPAYKRRQRMLKDKKYLRRCLARDYYLEKYYNPKSKNSVLDTEKIEKVACCLCCCKQKVIKEYNMQGDNDIVSDVVMNNEKSSEGDKSQGGMCYSIIVREGDDVHVRFSKEELGDMEITESA